MHQRHMCISFYFLLCEVFECMHIICTAVVATIKDVLSKDEAIRRELDVNQTGAKKSALKSVREGDNIEVGNTLVARKSV